MTEAVKEGYTQLSSSTVNFLSAYNLNVGPLTYFRPLEAKYIEEQAKQAKRLHEHFFEGVKEKCNEIDFVTKGFYNNNDVVLSLKSCPRKFSSFRERYGCFFNAELDQLEEYSREDLMKVRTKVVEEQYNCMSKIGSSIHKDLKDLIDKAPQLTSDGEHLHWPSGSSEAVQEVASSSNSVPALMKFGAKVFEVMAGKKKSLPSEAGTDERNDVEVPLPPLPPGPPPPLPQNLPPLPSDIEDF